MDYPNLLLLEKLYKFNIFVGFVFCIVFLYALLFSLYC